MSANLKDNENAKFRTDPLDGSVSVATAGSNSIKGLSVDHATSVTDVTDVPGPIPAVPLAKRNHISLHNIDSANTAYIGKVTVTTVVGWELGPGEKLNVDITDAILIYAVCSAGLTAKIKSWELA